MSSSDLFTKRVPSEASETADQFANHNLYQQALASAAAQTWNDTVPFDGNRKVPSSADEGSDDNGQSCTTASRAGSFQELDQISQEDFISSCKAWEKWYNIKQRDSQSVLAHRIPSEGVGFAAAA